MLVRQTDTQHVDILSAKSGSSAGSERPRKVSTTNQRKRSSLRQSTGAVGWPRESDTRKRGEYRGNSSQARGRKCPLQKVSSREICLAAVTPRRSPDAASAQLFGSPGWKQSSDPNCLRTWISHPPPFLETCSGARHEPVGPGQMCAHHEPSSLMYGASDRRRRGRPACRG
jgi:hypothetical protein